MLPTFLVIGAMKAGTTSLHHYLDRHPQVFMSRTKELHYFVEERNWRRGRAWYEEQFAPAGDGVVALGEASTTYTRYPEFRGVPARIAEVLPDVRLVYSIRDPIERMRSHYQHAVAEGDEREPIERALLSNPAYLNTSRYALQIEQYLEHFPPERLLIITSEDLRHARATTMRRVYEFIGVDPELAPPLDQEYYRTEDRRAYRGVAHTARRVAALRAMAQAAPRPIRVLVRRLGTREIDPGATIPAALRRRLEELLQEDVRRLQAHIGDGFGGWGLA